VDLTIDERIVTVGGGTGSFTMLSQLKRVASSLQAIVAMTDSGGSSRRLMDEFGRPLPLGDLRQALVALSRSSKLWGSIFSYRFPGEQPGTIGGHSLGNFILLALEDLNHGDLLGAIEDAQELLRTAGRVIPVTLERATLCAELDDGTVVRGESAIDQPGSRAILPIVQVFLDPPVKATPRACKALERADTILIGPGDLYTSVVPCLLANGVPEAIASCDGEVVYICNVMTKRGETDGYVASDFVKVIHRYLGRRVDTVVVNTATYPEHALTAYAAEGARPVRADVEELRALVPRVLTGAFAHTERLIRHDAERVLLAMWPHLNNPAGPFNRTRAEAPAARDADAPSLRRPRSAG
jgi:uncharacterized cofD-like protein